MTHELKLTEADAALIRWGLALARKELAARIQAADYFGADKAYHAAVNDSARAARILHELGWDDTDIALSDRMHAGLDRAGVMP